MKIFARFAVAAIAVAALCPSAAGACQAPARLLVLSAFPAEIDALLSRATIERIVVVDGRSFFVGRLARNDVVLALTGIGLVNAEETTRNALAHFDVAGIVFSGVSGTRFRIGDVMVPARWTEDDGESWTPVDAGMLAVAGEVAPTIAPSLGRCAPLGDPACLGVDPDLVTTPICIADAAQIVVGGDGRSSDPFGGKRLPCAPFGGDVFGCEACRRPSPPPPDVLGFVDGASTFLDPGLVERFFAFQNSPATGTLDADDMETAAVARVAAESAKPFIAFRAASDGQGDPLGLPGFPFQFFVYRQLAADNAATVTLAFLDAWSTKAHGKHGEGFCGRGKGRHP